jgi:hypothetical protein
MNPWNRLFVVIAICWVIVSPILVATEANRGPAQAFLIKLNCLFWLT